MIRSRSKVAAMNDVFANEHLELTDFYWPDATRQSAEAALSRLPIGSFLVRPSSKAACKVGIYNAFI